MAMQVPQNNPLMGFGKKHSLLSRTIGSRGVGGGIGRGLKFGALELEKSLINPTFSNAIRSIFNVSPLSNSKSNSFSAGNNSTFFGRKNNTQERNELFGKSQAIMLNKIYSITIESEKHLRGIRTLVGLAQQTNSLLRKMIAPSKDLQPKRDFSNNQFPFAMPKPANSNARFANDNSSMGGDTSGGGLGIGSILSSVIGTISFSSILPILIKGIKKVLSKTLTKIPIVGPLIALMLNLPGAIEIFEKEGFGEAFKDLISGSLSDLTFGIIDKETFSKHITKSLSSLMDGVMAIGNTISEMFDSVANMVKSMLGKIKIGPIKVPDILGGAIIEWDPFKGMRESVQGGPDYTDQQGIGADQAASQYHGAIDTVAAYDQAGARADATNPNNDKNIEVTGQWEGREKGDILTPDMLRAETGTGTDGYAALLKALIDSGQAKITDKPTNIQPRIQRAPPVIPDSIPSGSSRGRISAYAGQTPTVGNLPRGTSSRIDSQVNDRFARSDAANDRLQATQRPAQAPVIIHSAPVTNVTGAAGGGVTERSTMGTATMRSGWEERTAHGVAYGVP